MIYAEIRDEQHYSDVHDDLVKMLAPKFPQLEHGHQGDSWIWVFENNQKVEIVTFYSMQHQIKSSTKNATLVQDVISVISMHYEVEIYQPPEPEPHE